MKNFVLLHSGQQIHVAPGVRVLPAAEVSTLIDLAQLQQMVQEEIKQYRREVDAEAERIRQKAYESGFQDGQAQWTKVLMATEQAADTIASEAQQAMLPVIMKSVERILGHTLDADPSEIVPMVAQALRSVANFKQIIIYCRAQDLELLESAKESFLKQLELCKTLVIRPRADVEAGGCIIETEGGIVNAQLETLLKALERQLKQRFRDDKA